MWTLLPEENHQVPVCVSLLVKLQLACLLVHPLSHINISTTNQTTSQHMLIISLLEEWILIPYHVELTDPIEEESPCAGGDEERVCVVGMRHNVAYIPMDLAVWWSTASIVEDKCVG